LLAACVWMVWLERNKRMFNSSSHLRAANIYFLIFSLFKFWTGSSTNLEQILMMDRASTFSMQAASFPLTHPNGSQQAVGASSLSSEEDEDLLD
jgi:hypothetical protein